jgi:hypothetical protein
VNDPLSAKSLLSSLDKSGFITFQQARDLYEKRLELIQRGRRSTPEEEEDPQCGDRNNLMYLIDAIVSLEFEPQG